MEAQYLINSAYIKNNFNTTVISGVNYYPFTFDIDDLIERFISMATIIILPVCLCMGYPIFLLAIVNEKEKKLIEIMKINGLKMSNYWIVNYFFDWIFYWICIAVFWFAGTFVLGLRAFTHTGFMVWLVIFNGWGMAQISWAFLTSVFLNRTQTASIVGYCIAVYFMAIG